MSGGRPRTRGDPLPRERGDVRRPGELLGQLGKEDCLSVSMILDGVAWGELEVFTAFGEPRLGEKDAGFLRAIADTLVGAIHRAELFAQVEALAYTDSLKPPVASKPSRRQ